MSLSSRGTGEAKNSNKRGGAQVLLWELLQGQFVPTLAEVAWPNSANRSDSPDHATSMFTTLSHPTRDLPS